MKGGISLQSISRQWTLSQMTMRTCIDGEDKSLNKRIVSYQKWSETDDDESEKYMFIMFHKFMSWRSSWVILLKTHVCHSKPLPRPTEEVGKSLHGEFCVLHITIFSLSSKRKSLFPCICDGAQIEVNNYFCFLLWRNNGNFFRLSKPKSNPRQ